jgi:hypothetical protein
MRYSSGWLDFIKSKASNTALNSAVNTLAGLCRQYPTCRTLKPVLLADLEPSVKTSVDVSYLSEIIEEKQLEDTVGNHQESPPLPLRIQKLY